MKANYIKLCLSSKLCSWSNQIPGSADHLVSLEGIDTYFIFFKLSSLNFFYEI